MDRFLMRLSVGYPDRQQEIRMAAQFLSGATKDSVEPVCEAENIIKVREAVAEVTVKESGAEGKDTCLNT